MIYEIFNVGLKIELIVVNRDFAINLDGGRDSLLIFFGKVFKCIYVLYKAETLFQSWDRSSGSLQSLKRCLEFLCHFCLLG